MRDELIKILIDKLKQLADWFENSAARSDKEEKICRFETLKSAYLADAKNYRAMAKDIRATIKKAT
jgi:hypothetical protein